MSLLTSAVSMTKAMVQIDSTDPGTYEKAMADWIEQQLSDLSNVLITRENVLPGRPNLMAEIPGPKHLPALVMICHMDTVVIGDGWTLPPFEAIEKDGKIYGRGACDMKSGLACCLSAFIMAARTLQTCGQTPKRSLKLICSMDEEDFIEEAYILEVSSPGLGRPLKKDKDLERSLGESVDVKLFRAMDRQKEFTGILKAWDKDTVTLEFEEEAELVIERSNIALIRLAFDF